MVTDFPLPIQHKARISTGPAMAALSPAQQRFVIAMIETGSNKVRAALQAGYGSDKDGEGQNYHSAATAGSRLAAHPKVRAALKEQSVAMLEASTLKAAATMVGLLDNPDPRVRHKAAEQVLDRSGLTITHKQEIAVVHDDMENKSVRELLEYIRTQSVAAGVDPKKLLAHEGIDPNVIDAEFTEVDKKDVIISGEDYNEKVIASSEGLEDLLG